MTYGKLAVVMGAILVGGAFLLWDNPLKPVSAQNATTGMAAPQLAGTGAPTYSCTANNLANVLYVQTDATNGKFWQCGGTLGWVHFPGPVASATDASTFTGGVLSVGTVQTHTITIPGVVMTGAAACNFTSDPGSTFIAVNGYVTAANTVTVKVTVLLPSVTATTVTATSASLPLVRCEVY